MSDYNENNRNNAADTEPVQNGYQPPQYSQQYTTQNNGYQPPNYTQQYNPSYEQPTYDPSYAVPQGYPQKSRIAAALLAFLFGTFGVHNFYLGHTGKGVTQIPICDGDKVGDDHQLRGDHHQSQKGGESQIFSSKI